MRHQPREHLPRHPHDHGFAALLLSGGYVEAGDTGRHRLEPGDVLVHRSWESHLDGFGVRGAEVLVFALEDDAALPVLGQIADPDTLVQLSERDPVEALQVFQANLAPRVATVSDWPDMLAQALRDDPSLCLGEWADASGLHLGSVSRGFGQAFGVSPVAYRLVQRTRRALYALTATCDPLSAIAHDCGFADQAHMTRAVVRLTQATPMALRRGAVS
jgi:AraC-like DNA-binding protein